MTTTFHITSYPPDYSIPEKEFGIHKPFSRGKSLDSTPNSLYGTL